jgi:hypothetical protein
MTTATRWFTAVLVAAAIGLVAPAAGLAADIILQDGARAIIDDNKLFLMDRAGKRTLAKDGTFQTKDGKSIVVQRGIIIQNAGAEKGIILQNPAPSTR